MHICIRTRYIFIFVINLKDISSICSRIKNLTQKNEILLLEKR